MFYIFRIALMAFFIWLTLFWVATSMWTVYIQPTYFLSVKWTYCVLNLFFCATYFLLVVFGNCNKEKTANLFPWMLPIDINVHKRNAKQQTISILNQFFKEKTIDIYIVPYWLINKNKRTKKKIILNIPFIRYTKICNKNK